MNYYAGIGSRETPDEIKRMMMSFATAIEDLGWTLRSGGADGADTAFSMGTTKKKIYIPWAGFNGLHHDGDTIIDIAELPEEVVLPAREIAKQYHPAWHKCTPHARMLHTRNVFQIHGEDYKNPSKFVLCWTIGGKGQGGTGQAIRLARAVSIPVFDLGSPDIEKVQQDCINFVGAIECRLKLTTLSMMRK